MSSAIATRADGQVVDLSQVAEICERYGIVELSVFGSVAQGNAGPDSDIDLLYVLSPGARLGFCIDDLEDELAELFDRHVDLVARKAVHRLLRDEVDRASKTLYAA
jgi:predicted nucleotidyltransferase